MFHQSARKQTAYDSPKIWIRILAIMLLQVLSDIVENIWSTVIYNVLKDEKSDDKTETI